MASINVNPDTRVIYVPKDYLTHITGTLYELDTNELRLDLKEWEASEEGMPYPDTHSHNTEVVVAGVTYARTIEIINNYTITFENDLYSVRLVGSNNNIFDIENGILNQNYVQVIPTNSAGLQIVSTGSGLSGEQDDKLTNINAKINNIDSDVDSLLTEQTSASEYLKRIIGLVHENFYIDLPTFDNDNNMTSARIRIYSDAESVGSYDNVIGTYTIEVNPDGPGKFTTWKQVKE